MLLYTNSTCWWQKPAFLMFSPQERCFHMNSCLKVVCLYKRSYLKENAFSHIFWSRHFFQTQTDTFRNWSSAVTKKTKFNGYAIQKHPIYCTVYWIYIYCIYQDISAKGIFYVHTENLLQIFLSKIHYWMFCYQMSASCSHAFKSKRCTEFKQHVRTSHFLLWGNVCIVVYMIQKRSDKKFCCSAYRKQ